MFARIFYAACLAGLTAGLTLTMLQAVGVTPIILEAESYESASGVPAHGGELQSAHSHALDSWAPEDGIERTLWTAVSNVGAAIGFALLVCAMLAWRDRADWRQGLLWGLAGFVVFFANPSLGLHPEIPGAEAAALVDRQLWWVATVLLSAAGVGALIFGRGAPWKALCCWSCHTWSVPRIPRCPAGLRRSRSRSSSRRSPPLPTPCFGSCWD